jgi:hypothetical protein
MTYSKATKLVLSLLVGVCVGFAANHITAGLGAYFFCWFLDKMHNEIIDLLQEEDQR